MSKVSVEELSKHDKIDDLWVAINGKVYDFTQFAPEHPGTSCQKSKSAFPRRLRLPIALSISINTSYSKHTQYNVIIMRYYTYTHTHTHIHFCTTTGGEALVSEQAGETVRSVEHAHPESIEAYDGIESVEESFRGMLDGKALSKHKSENGSFSNRQKELETFC